MFSAAELVICFSDLLPGNKLALACVFALFVSFPFAVLNVLPGAMMADIIQYDTVTTGVNQEGIFGAARPSCAASMTRIFARISRLCVLLPQGMRWS